MKLSEFKKKLDTLDIPVNYKVFKTEPNVPFIVFSEIESSNFIADEEVYVKISFINIELYTSGKNTILENKIEKLLNEFGTWSKSETYIEKEDLMLVLFRIKMEVENE